MVISSFLAHSKSSIPRLLSPTNFLSHQSSHQTSHSSSQTHHFQKPLPKMAVISTNNHHISSSSNDPLLLWLHSIKKALDNLYTDSNQHNSEVLRKLVFDCITTFKNNPKYQNDIRFLRVWFIYMDCVGNFDAVYKEMEELRICMKNSVLYETCALFLEAKGQFIDADRIYTIGISRNAEPIESLKKAHKLFLQRISDLAKTSSNHQKVNGDTGKLGKTNVDPWSDSTTNDVLQKILPRLVNYDGYHYSSRNYPGKVALSTLHNSSRNKIIKIGGRDYQIKGCAGQGGFAQVFKACVNSDPEEVVALKIQTPPFPWEFYMYRQLDKRLSNQERSRFGSAQKMHHYSDYSILVCDYLSHGTLQDAINSHVVVGQFMEEVSCIYYTIEMLHILEGLHGAGIIHGDFKPDNLLIRNASKDLTDDTEDFIESRGPWQDQGLCLVDWGRGIDMSLFPAKTEFIGDCRTSGFRCVEMKEKKPWKFQVDTYGLCVVVHMMLHNTYMEIKKEASSDGSCYYLPKLPLKRYWSVKLWENLFRRLLNVQPGDDHLKMLQELRESFEKYMLTDSSLVRKLKDSLRKQRLALCSA